MNDNELDRIAAMANALRPDWPLDSLRTLLRRPELACRSRRDMAVALAWVACESESKTPARVVESGPWWHAANVETPERVVRRPPRRDQECRQHPGEWADACRPCATEGRENEPEPTKETPMPPDAISPAAAARALIRQAKAALCDHGVPLRNCAECETETREDA